MATTAHQKKSTTSRSQEADLFNFTFQIPSSSGETLNVFLPQPNAVEIKRLAPILGRIFSAMRTEKADIVVMLKDWEFVVENALSDLTSEKAENVEATLNTFLDRSLASAHIITLEGAKVEKLDDDETLYFKGILLFISSLYRYSLKENLKSDLRDYFTPLSYSDWHKQFVSGKEADTAPKGPRVKV